MEIQSIRHNGNEIHYRWVYSHVVGTDIRFPLWMVGIQDEYDRFLSNDRHSAGMLSCYVPRDVFETYEDEELKKYALKKMYSF